MLGFPGVVDHHQTERSATRRYVLAVTVGAYGDVHVRPRVGRPSRRPLPAQA